MLSPPLSFPFELPSPLPEEGWPWLRSLVARLDQLAGENAELKERVLQQAESPPMPPILSIRPMFTHVRQSQTKRPNRRFQEERTAWDSVPWVFA